MNRKLFLPVFLLLLSAQIIFSQTVAKGNKDGISPETRKDAVAFLRETSVEVNGLRTLENRISFSAELAGLMWFHNEKEARTMFQTVISDFRQLLAQYDTQINAAGVTPNEEQSLMPDASSAAQLSRKFMKAVAVRQQIATAISEHDPKLALEFFNDTALVITNPAYRKQIESQDSYFETRLLQQIAEKDVDTALKYGRKSLEKGFNYENINLLKKIYAKDADKGIAFGEDVLAKLKSDGAKPDSFYILNSLLDFGAENFDSVKGKSGKKTIFSEQSLRDLADLFAQQILKREDGEESGFAGYISQIERFAPSRATQIRQKFGIKPIKIAAKSVPEIMPTEMLGAKLIEDSPEKSIENVQNLGTQLPKEEREKIISEARKTIGAMKDPTEKLAALIALASQVAKLGDKELSLEIMDEGRNLVNFQPKNYMDFMKTWLFASGYAQVDAGKAFPILEDAIFRLNDTISAFVKVGEFIDVNGDFIEDGEVQVGGFGGEITRELLQNLGAANITIHSLAIADFARTRTLTNKFDRPEVRILAKMLVLRGVLGDNGKSKKEDIEIKATGL
ncbi:MAG: hypothetical protein ACR2MG_05790 [Pyrinomonadaceae bacterium]